MMISVSWIIAITLDPSLIFEMWRYFIFIFCENSGTELDRNGDVHRPISVVCAAVLDSLTQAGCKVVKRRAGRRKLGSRSSSSPRVFSQMLFGVTHTLFHISLNELPLG